MSALTFRGNLATTRYGWLRLTPAYSVALVRSLIADLPPNTRVLDPFCGSGTTLLACGEQGLSCDTVDLNPFLVWLANAKAARYTGTQREAARQLVAQMAKASRARHRAWVPSLANIDRWWDGATLTSLSNAFRPLSEAGAGRAQDLARLSFCRTLIRTARVSFGHQSMSFGGAKPTERVATVLREELGVVEAGLKAGLKKYQRGARLGDARTLQAQLRQQTFDRVITSPPYCNRMSYIRELRPYMYWLGYLDEPRGAGELDWAAIGGTWGIATSRLEQWAPPAGCRKLDRELRANVRNIGGRSQILARYVERYFVDMEEHVTSVMKRLNPGASLHYVIGNSSFYGELVATERALARSFRRHGLRQVGITTLRSRTSKKELVEYMVSAVAPA